MKRPHIGFLTTLTTAIFLFALSSEAQTPASIKEMSKRTVAMPAITDCAKLGVCDLKSVKLVERKLKVLLPNEHSDYATYMTDTRFVVEVAKASQIPNYGVVQFMKGCMFESELRPDDSIRQDFTYIHKNFGRYKLVKHDDWIIDSSHADPLTSSFENYGRFDLYKWNANPASLEADSATWYFDAKPPHGTVFKSDLIGTTGLIEGAANPSARNSSLDLETCIFKIGDLPKTTDETGAGVDKSKALWCASWDHKFIYDFATSKVNQEKVIHPFCAEIAERPI